MGFFFYESINLNVFYEMLYCLKIGFFSFREVDFIVYGFYLVSFFFGCIFVYGVL